MKNQQVVYLKKTQFDKIKAIETFPNPNIKVGIYNGQECRLIVAGTVEIKRIVDKDLAAWYGVKMGVYIGSCNLGHFPRELIAGINKGVFSEKHGVSLLTGWVNAQSYIGSANDIFKNVQPVIDILKENNFEVIYDTKLSKEEIDILASYKLNFSLL